MNDPIVMLLGPTDPRMAKYPLMTSVMLTVLFSTIYLVFIKVLGPAWMKNKDPFDLRPVMIIYNAFLFGLNGWITLQLMKYGWLTAYNWQCEPIDTSDNPIALKIVQVCWVFFISKLIEYFDTVIFVLRKKYSQITFLHVFHHSTVPVISWFSCSYGPGGYNTFFALVNSFIHVWMYLYYGLAALGPAVQKYLWWKKYLTLLQLAQFVAVFLYFVHLCFFAPNSCNVSQFLASLSLGPSIVYFALFTHFYLRNYKVSSRISRYLKEKSIPKKE